MDVVSIFPLRLSSSRWILDKLYRPIVFSERARELFQHRDADLLFVQGTPYRFEAVLQLWATKKLLDPPMIFNFDDANFLHRPYLTKWLIQISERTLVPSRRLMEYARCFTSNVEYFPLGVNTERFRPPESPSHSTPMKVVWFGNTTSHIRNLLFLRDVFDGLDPQVAKLFVIGETTERLKEIFNPLGSQCQLKGYFKQEHLMEFLREVDLGTVPIEDNLWANSKYPVKTVEMLASGLPVIVSRNSEAARIIDPGVSGVSLSNDETAWRDAIRELSQDRDTLLQMKKNARTNAQDAHSMEVLADQAVTLFEDLVNENQE